MPSDMSPVRAQKAMEAFWAGAALKDLDDDFAARFRELRDAYRAQLRQHVARAEAAAVTGLDMGDHMPLYIKAIGATSDVITSEWDFWQDS